MTELPQDIQLALVSFLAALLIGGPVALFARRPPAGPRPAPESPASPARYSSGTALRPA